MTNRFLGTSNASASLSDGTADIFINSLTVNNLNPSRALKTNAVSQLISTDINIGDVSGLQAQLDAVITTPYNGTIAATNFDTSALGASGKLTTSRVGDNTDAVGINLTTNTIDLVATNTQVNGVDIFPVDGSKALTGDLTIADNNIIYTLFSGLSINTVAPTNQGITAISIGREAGELNQGASCVAIGNRAGESNQSAASVAIGSESGQTSQGGGSIAIGTSAGQTSQVSESIAIGSGAGQTNQSGIAIGENAGNLNQGSGIAIGFQAAQDTQGDGIAIGLDAGKTAQSNGTVAVGNSAGQTTQGLNSTAIGLAAGQTNQGSHAISLGAFSGEINQHDDSILINASTSNLNSTASNQIKMKAGTSTLDVSAAGGLSVNGSTEIKAFDQDLNTTDGVSFDTVNVTDTTNSTSQITGALVVTGGVGITGNSTIGNTRLIGGRALTIGTGTANTTMGATTNTTDERRVRFQNPSQIPDVEICQPNAPESTSNPCSILTLNKNTAGKGGVRLNYFYNGTVDTTPNAGSNLSKMCIAFTGSPCSFDFFQDGSLYTGGLKYNQGDKAGVGTDGLVIEDSTASTSTTTGALKVTGGVGVQGALYAGGAIVATGGQVLPNGRLLVIGDDDSDTTHLRNVSTTGRKVKFANNTAVPEVHVSQAGAPESTVTPCSIFQLNKGVSAKQGVTLAYFYNGTVDTTPNAGSNLSNFCIAFNGQACSFEHFQDGSLHVGGLKYNQGDKAGVGTDGLVIEDTTASTSTTTGALQVAGGVGIGGDLNIDGTINGLSAPGGAFTQINNTTVANTTTETDTIGTIIGSKTVPANTFKAGDSYIIEAGGVMSCLNNSILTIRIYAGPTSNVLLGEVPSLTIPTSTGKWHGLSCYFVVRQIGAATTAVISTRAVYSQNVNSQNGLVSQSFHTINSTTFDTTVDNVLKITVQWGTADAGNTYTTTQCTLFKSY